MNALVSCRSNHHLRLRLWYIDNATTHTTDEDHAARRLALHEVSRNLSCEQVCAVDVHAPKLAQTVDRVVNGLEVLGEAGACHQVVDLAMLLDDLVYAALNTILI